MFAFSKLLEYFAAPSHFALMLLALGAALLYTRFFAWGRRLAAVAAALLLVMALGPLGQMLASPLENRFPPPPDDMAPPDEIIVLGGSVDEELTAERGRVALNEAAERLTAPIGLLRRYPKARLIFSGGTAAIFGSRHTEAEATRLFWREVGLDAGDALYEDRSRNTAENARFTYELAGPKPGERWLLVTSAMHMPRAVGLFRHAGFPVIAYPVDFHVNRDFFRFRPLQATSRAVGLVDAAAHEWTGLLVARASGSSDALFPAP